MSAIHITEQSATHTTVRLPVSLKNIRDGIWIDLSGLGADCHALAKDDHIIACFGKSGCVAVPRRKLRAFAKEWGQLAEVWEDVPT